MAKRTKEDVSLLVSGAGWIGGLVDSLVRELRARGVSDAEIHALVTEDGKVPMRKIADGILEAIRPSHPTFRLVGRSTSCTTEELVKAGTYDWVNDYITSRNFPIRSHEPDEADVVLLDFDHDPTSEEALVVAEKQGLVRPTYEDALRFGIQHPEEQRKSPIVFLHEPWLGPHDYRFVVGLRGGASDRRLSLGLFVGRWGRDFRFAFLRK